MSRNSCFVLAATLFGYGSVAFGPGAARRTGQGNGPRQLQYLPHAVEPRSAPVHGRRLDHRIADDAQSRARRCRRTRSSR